MHKTKKQPIGSKTEPSFAKLTVALKENGGKFRHVSPLLVRSFRRMERTGTPDAQRNFVWMLEPLTERHPVKEVRKAAKETMKSIMAEINEFAIRNYMRF